MRKKLRRNGFPRTVAATHDLPQTAFALKCAPAAKIRQCYLAERRHPARQDGRFDANCANKRGAMAIAIDRGASNFAPASWSAAALRRFRTLERIESDRSIRVARWPQPRCG